MERTELARLLAESLKRAGIGAAQPSRTAAVWVIRETDPARFMVALTEAAAGSGPVFLADPAWGAAEHASFDRLTKSKIRDPKSEIEKGWLCVPTGGTGGEVKLARHDGETLAAAVRGFCRHAGVERSNGIGVLPMHHIGGLLAWLRCALTGGEFRAHSWKEIEGGALPDLPPDPCFVSLVPTQLQRLLPKPDAVAWLRRFKTVHLGGGPMWRSLADAAADARIPVAPAYGMTETAAMACASDPESFLAGDRSCGVALPHMRVSLNEDGAIMFEGDSLFRGYWPEERRTGTYVSSDTGRLDERGRLHVLSRIGETINTGGRKVHPVEVEDALRASGLFEDVMVVGVPDADWGEAVVACYPQGGGRPDPVRLEAALERLAPYKRPKRFQEVTDWPRNPLGKARRAEMRERLMTGN